MIGGTIAGMPLPASDGCALVLDAHVPEGAGRADGIGRVPCVVTRTPYGRSAHLAEGRGWRERGLAYVVQDVRGRHDLDGAWAPYRGEREDGAALVDWITAQPWSDGRVVAYGGSYSGYTAWAMAVERPDAVRAVVSLGPSMSLARTKFGGGGILRLAEHASWWLERGDARTSRDGLAARVFRERPGILRHLPVLDLPRAMGAHLPSWAGIVEDGADARTGRRSRPPSWPASPPRRCTWAAGTTCCCRRPSSTTASPDPPYPARRPTSSSAPGSTTSSPARPAASATSTTATTPSSRGAGCSSTGSATPSTAPSRPGAPRCTCATPAGSGTTTGRLRTRRCAWRGPRTARTGSCTTRGIRAPPATRASTGARSRPGPTPCGPARSRWRSRCG
ncbi:CocE/NonD family hydrolase [Clavibacter tessellarius]